MQNWLTVGAVFVALASLLWTVYKDRRADGRDALVRTIKAVLAEEGGVVESIADLSSQLSNDRVAFQAHTASDERQFAEIRTGLAAIHSTLQTLPLAIVAALRREE